MMPPQKRPIPLPSQGTLFGWAKKRQTIAETVVDETITKTDNVLESAKTSDIGEVVGDVDNRSVAVDNSFPTWLPWQQWHCHTQITQQTVKGRSVPQNM